MFWLINFLNISIFFLENFLKQIFLFLLRVLQHFFNVGFTLSIKILIHIFPYFCYPHLIIQFIIRIFSSYFLLLLKFFKNIIFFNSNLDFFLLCLRLFAGACIAYKIRIIILWLILSIWRLQRLILGCNIRV